MTEIGARARRVEAWLLTAALFVIGSAIVVAGAREWFPPLASEHGAGIDRMMFYLLATTGSLVLIGHAALGCFVFRFSRKREEAYVPPSTGAQRLWSILPAFVIALVAEGGVLVLGLPVWTQLYGSTAPPNAVVVEVTAEQFAWNVRYPGPDGVFGRTAPQLIDVENPIGLDPTDPSARDDLVGLGEIFLPVGRPARIRLRSKDVLHSFYLPSQRIKQDAVPGMAIDVWFVPTREGDFEIACAELCGFGHYTMRGALHVVTKEAFERHLSSTR